MLYLIAILSIFPAIVAVILRGKFYKYALILSAINIAIAVIARLHYFPATGYCENYGMNNCGTSFQQYLIVSTFNAIFAAIAWYLAFKRTADNQKGPTKDAVNRKALSGVGIVITAFILLVLMSLALAITSM